MAYHMKSPRFLLGNVVATPGVLSLGLDLNRYLQSHHCGDWGDLCNEDKELNEAALATSERLMSCSQVGDGKRIYIITEANRSVTTVLLPEEY